MAIGDASRARAAARRAAELDQVGAFAGLPAAAEQAAADLESGGAVEAAAWDAVAAAVGAGPLAGAVARARGEGQ